ncbi:MAG: putative toxin-antitoxin system toxin component, PIN family [Azonexus sp.]|nr:putative toxin-antitoxin system toxin component, PIN family [Betaproteobacteria bacterium]MBK8917864.1 putative toxin-antitoxin system toxin component, PIN family [Betaproteobacteria bacterium]MBP6037525.1 putative toxin-antitoxin system toxin component, PIN family [Azonexus sp.]MBP6908098.1 putative toxin-antitoxin system toxin component, PIN family [Azonexus sp.]
MRIVLDTNVVLSALLWRGTPHRLLDVIRSRGDARLFTSPALLDELADVLTRPSATKRLALIGRTVREVLADYVEAVEVVEPEQVPRVVPTDVDDDQVIAAAIAAGADWIVSGDADLLSMESHEGIPIITAAQAAQQIAG